MSASRLGAAISESCLITILFPLQVWCPRQGPLEHDAGRKRKPGTGKEADVVVLGPADFRSQLPDAALPEAFFELLHEPLAQVRALVGRIDTDGIAKHRHVHAQLDELVSRTICPTPEQVKRVWYEADLPICDECDNQGDVIQFGEYPDDCPHYRICPTCLSEAAVIAGLVDAHEPA